jgi:hypothetical protein
VMLASLAISGCRSIHAPKTSIEITVVPPANPGGPEQMGDIEGRVTGLSPGQQIVLYARSEVWWIQPFTNAQFTRIQPDSTWKNSTHLGTEYAALLVDSNYQPAPRLTELPKIGNGVAAVMSQKGTPGAPIVSKVIHFSGYDWKVRSFGSDRGGTVHAYDADNVWIDNKGYLHLRMGEYNGRWSCAEVNLIRSLGYGTYRFVVQDSAHLPLSAVVGLFTWDDIQSQNYRNELDIELSKWDNPQRMNAQYVVQPFYDPENLSRFAIPAGTVTHMFRWEPGSVAFKSFPGSGPITGANSIGDHVFTSGIPAPANETVHIDIYDFHHSETSSKQPAEVVIEKFEYLP